MTVYSEDRYNDIYLITLFCIGTDLYLYINNTCPYITQNKQKELYPTL